MESEDTTKNRLLDAAEELFCQKGFDGTSVRDLTAAAGCNLASINYYFGGKDKLYAEMFRRQVEDIMITQIAAIDAVCSNPKSRLEDLLRTLITPILTAAYRRLPRGRVMKLLVRDVLGNEPLLGGMVEAFRQRLFERTVEALMQIESRLDERAAQMAANSIDSLKLHPFLFMDSYMAMVHRLTLDELIEYLVRFACYAIRGITAQGQEAKR